jgi:hypothetical protein
MKIQAILTTFRHSRRLTLQIQLKHDSIQFFRDARPGAKCATNDDMARKTVTQMSKGLGAIEMVSVVFRSVDRGVVEWIHTAERNWVPKAEKYSVVVDRSAKGKEMEAKRRKQPFHLG